MSSRELVTRENIPIWRKLLPSFSSIIILTFLIISLFMNGGLQPYKRGFFCNDSSIQYPLKADTVSFKLLLVIALIIPIIVIKLLEMKLARLLNNCSLRPRSRSTQYSNDASKQLAEEETLVETTEKVKRRLVLNDDDGSDLEACDTAPATFDTCDMSRNDDDDENTGRQNSNDSIAFKTENGIEKGDDNVLKEVIKFRMMMRQSICKRKVSDVHVFMFGFVATSFLTGIGKMACGRLRPHFMQRCVPNIDCTLIGNTNRYIEDFECTNKMLRPREYSYITTSWPSGHAAMIFYSMLYLIFYVNSVTPAINRLKISKKAQSNYNPLLVYSIYVLMIGLAVYIALTRISDYHHHPLDVLSGTIIGTIVAIVLAKYVHSPLLMATRPST